MALWQYSFQLVPKSANLIDGEIFLNREITANLDFWHKVQFSTVDTAEIRSVLPLVKSWSNDLLFFGNADSSCLIFLVEENFILESELKVDLRTDFFKFIETLKNIKFMQNVFLLDESGYVLTINSPTIALRITNSKHYNKFNKLYK